jgi:hypothetical protein
MDNQSLKRVGNPAVPVSGDAAMSPVPPTTTTFMMNLPQIV